MPIISSNAKEIHCKIIYYGAKDSGKTSSLNFIQENSSKNNIKSLNIPIDCNLQSLILFVGQVLEFKTWFHIYNISNCDLKEKEILLRGVDGIVFVANSDLNKEQENKNSLEELHQILEKQNKDIFKIPLAVQYNKRDLDKISSIEVLRAQLNKYNSKDFESSVTQGIGVIEPLKHVCKFVLTSVRSGELL